MRSFCVAFVKFQAVAFLVVAVISCAPPPTEIRVTIEQSAVPQLQGLPGEIGITVQNQSQVRRYRLSGGLLRDVSELPRAEKTASAGIGPYGATMFLDDTPDYYVSGPYQTSPDRKLLAASVELKASPGIPTSYVIVDLNAKKTIALNKTDKLRVYALAWSPDSKFLAIVRREQTRVGHSPKEVLMSIAGHQVQYSIFSLEIVDASGKLVARSLLTKENEGTSSEIIWI